jgi:hypothetical protein
MSEPLTICACCKLTVIRSFPWEGWKLCAYCVRVAALRATGDVHFAEADLAIREGRKTDERHHVDMGVECYQRVQNALDRQHGRTGT